MSDSDDPFLRKKRTSKPAKRRRRPERRLFNDESDTDDDRVGPAIGRRAGRPKAVKPPKNTNHRVAFGVPKDLFKEKQPSDGDGDDEDEPRPDYSAAGLQRLRDLTFKEPPSHITEPVVENPPPSPPTKAKPTVPLPVASAKEVIDVDYEPMDISMSAPPPPRHPLQSNMNNSSNTKKQRDIDNGVGFLLLDRERTDEKLGVLGGDDLDAMELDVTGNDGSGAEEWEREQLRRAGLDISGDNDLNLANHEARGIIEEEEEEDLGIPISISVERGGGGEIGHTAVDTFLESIEEAIHATKYKMEQCGKKLEEVRKSRVEIEGKPFVIEAIHLPEPPPPPPPPPPPELPAALLCTDEAQVLSPVIGNGSLYAEYEHFLPARDWLLSSAARPSFLKLNELAGKLDDFKNNLFETAPFSAADKMECIRRGNEDEAASWRKCVEEWADEEKEKYRAEIEKRTNLVKPFLASYTVGSTQFANHSVLNLKTAAIVGNHREKLISQGNQVVSRFLLTRAHPTGSVC